MKDYARISDMVTEKGKIGAIQDVVEKLQVLATHSCRKDLIKKIFIVSRRCEQVHHDHGLLNRLLGTKYKEETNALYLSSDGVEEKTIVFDNFRYSRFRVHGYDSSPIKIGGEVKSSSTRIVDESEFPTIAEKYDFRMIDLQKVIDRINEKFPAP